MKKLTKNQVRSILNEPENLIDEWLSNRKRKKLIFNPDDLYHMKVFIILRRLSSMSKEKAYGVARELTKSKHCDYWLTMQGDEWVIETGEPEYGSPYIYIDLYYIARCLEMELEDL